MTGSNGSNGKTMRQNAPFPEHLEWLVTNLDYRPGWYVSLGDMARDHVDPADDTSPELAGGLTLVITTKGFNSYHINRGESYRVNHYFGVPAATYSDASWQRWLFECFAKVELHEAMEFFTIAGKKPYAPNHSPGEDPYIVHDLTTNDLRSTSFQGIQK